MKNVLAIRYGLRALDYSSESGCEQIIFPGVVATSIGTPIGTSDHSAVCATIKTEQAVPDVSFSRKIFIKSRTDWHGISTDLSNVDWPHIYHLPDSVSALNNYIIDIFNKGIPSCNLKLCLKDKAWFNDYCREAFF